jgi:hypothetical protein
LVIPTEKAVSAHHDDQAEVDIGEIVEEDQQFIEELANELLEGIVAEEAVATSGAAR